MQFAFDSRWQEATTCPRAAQWISKGWSGLFCPHEVDVALPAGGGWSWFCVKASRDVDNVYRAISFSRGVFSTCITWVLFWGNKSYFLWATHKILTKHPTIFLYTVCKPAGIKSLMGVQTTTYWQWHWKICWFGCQHKGNFELLEIS